MSERELMIQTQLQDLFALEVKAGKATVTKQTLKGYLHTIETTLRDAESMMRSLHPDFNSVPNAERFIISCLKANEALRQMQRGNMETVEKYWRGES